MGGTSVGPNEIEAAVLGGLTLGGGGGGLPEMGLEMGLLAHRVGRPRLIDVNSLRDDEYVVCVSAVGAPAASESVPALNDFALALQMLERTAGIKISGLITNENGALSTLNAYMASAASGIPMLDLAANGRAHPTTLMGAMGLERLPDYESFQVVVTAERGATSAERGRTTQIAVRGSLDAGGRVVRDAAAQAGGLVVVARNPVPLGYARTAGVEGALAEAIRIGKHMLAARPHGPDALRNAVKEAASLESISVGTVVGNDIQTQNGFDAGVITVADDGGARYELTFLNEFMSVDTVPTSANSAGGGTRLATFPDLIVLLNVETGMPLTTAQVRRDMRVEIGVAPKSSLLLGRGMTNPDLFLLLEDTLQRPFVSYAFDEPSREKAAT